MDGGGVAPREKSDVEVCEELKVLSLRRQLLGFFFQNPIWFMSLVILLTLLWNLAFSHGKISSVIGLAPTPPANTTNHAFPPVEMRRFNRSWMDQSVKRQNVFNVSTLLCYKSEQKLSKLAPPRICQSPYHKMLEDKLLPPFHIKRMR